MSSGGSSKDRSYKFQERQRKAAAETSRLSRMPISPATEAQHKAEFDAWWAAAIKTAERSFRKPPITKSSFTRVAQGSDSQWATGWVPADSIDGSTFEWKWDTDAYQKTEVPSPMTQEHEESDPGYSLEGEFQGERFTVDKIGWDESPIDAVIRAVLGLNEEDELVSVAVKRDGQVEVLSWEQIKPDRGW